MKRIMASLFAITLSCSLSACESEPTLDSENVNSQQVNSVQESSDIPAESEIKMGIP